MRRSRALAATMLALILAGMATASSSQTPDARKVPVDGGGSYTKVGVSGLARLLEKKDFPLINVHIPYEGEIAGTDLFIPFDHVEANLARLPADKHAKVVLYCRSGSMSAIAARALVRLGYTDIWDLDGGMIAWKAAGREVLQKSR